MKEKIEEILGRHERDDVFGITQELLHLIQEERKKDREMIYKDIQANYHITADEFYKQYLQSLDKGDKDE